MITDEERQWVEGQNRIWDDINQCFYVDETVERLLESEKAAWEEVNRLQKENEQLNQFILDLVSNEIYLVTQLQNANIVIDQFCASKSTGYIQEVKKE